MPPGAGRTGIWTAGRGEGGWADVGNAKGTGGGWGGRAGSFKREVLGAMGRRSRGNASMCTREMCGNTAAAAGVLAASSINNDFSNNTKICKQKIKVHKTSKFKHP